MRENLIVGTSDAWDDGALGRSAEHAKVVNKDIAEAIDNSMGLKSISLRLQESLIEDLKTIAMVNGMGYQPLIRTVLTRFAESELRQIAKHQAEVATAKRIASESGEAEIKVKPYETAILKDAA